MQLVNLIVAAFGISSATAATVAPRYFRLKASADAPPVVAGKYLGIGYFNINSPGASLGWNNPDYTPFEGSFVKTNQGSEIYLRGAKEKQIVYLKETIMEVLRPKYEAKVGIPTGDPNPADGTPVHDAFKVKGVNLGYNFATKGFLADWTACGSGPGAKKVDLFLGKSPVFDTGCYASFKLEVEYVN